MKRPAGVLGLIAAVAYVLLRRVAHLSREDVRAQVRRYAANATLAFGLAALASLSVALLVFITSGEAAARWAADGASAALFFVAHLVFWRRGVPLMAGAP